MKTRISWMLVLVTVSLVAWATAVKAGTDTNKIVFLASNSGHQSSWALTEVSSKTWNTLELFLKQPRLPQPRNTPPVQPKQVTPTASATKFVGTKDNIAEEAKVAKLAEAMVKMPPKSLCDGTEQKDFLSGDRSSVLTVFSIQPSSSYEWFRIQILDHGSIKDDCRTPPSQAIAVAGSFSFP